MNHVELFAGIGGFRQAMDLISADLKFPIKTIAYSELDEKAIATYKANFDTTDEIAMGDIVKFVADSKPIEKLPSFEILSGGFPCQTFSMMGHQAGFNEERGQMFFRIMDIINKKRPQYVLLENVKNLKTHDRGNTIAVISTELERAGYIVKYDVFNTNDFGLPQKRNRVIIFARLKQFGDFQFSSNLVIEAFNQLNTKHCSLNFYNSTIDVLEKNVDSKFYLSEKIKPTLLSDGSAGFKSNSDIDQTIARPLTASMHKMHRACQDNYFSDIYIQSHGAIRPSENMSKEELAKIAIRKLTPKEAFLLQGFPQCFAKNASVAKVSNGAMYKQAGNAVSVNTIYAVLNYLITNKIIHN
ncbi:MAG: DNA (cytosine-5-)-methyltransferase [Muribaculaceae bacterium]|nr:DNA (cytosine-5-)-methyltransferase [Muribaculaceae bacterium]